MTTTQSVDSIAGKLAELDVLERAISARRRDLHDRIDGIYLHAPLHGDEAKLLRGLEDQEHDVSAERRKLHAQIDVLRAEVGLRRWRED